LNPSSEKLVSKFAFNFDLYRYNELSSFQMLLNVAPTEGLMLLVIGPVWDYWIVGETVGLLHHSGVPDWLPCWLSNTVQSCTHSRV
jgi:hypothetical protein